MAKKKITDKEILEALNGKNSKKFQSIVNHIEGKQLTKYYDVLFEVLKVKFETLNGASQSQYYDIYEASMTLGLFQYTKAIPLLETIAYTRSGIASIGAGCAYIRLVRKDKADFSKIFKFFDFANQKRKNKEWNFGNYHAALFAINLDRMVPNIDDQKRFIAYSWDYISCYEKEEEGFNTRCVTLIASCCAGFEVSLTKSLLYKIYELELVNKSYGSLQAKNALEKHYSYYDPTA
jgi:hypothetical protein